MGMYTELVLGLKVSSNDEIIGMLKYMLDNDNISKPTHADYSHKFFSTDRWSWMLIGSSYYFDGQTDSKLIRDDLFDGRPDYYLNVRCSIKNYNQEFQLFLDWLEPYIDTHGFLGYMRYEEDDDPTLIYHDKTYHTIDYKRLPIKE